MTDEDASEAGRDLKELADEARRTDAADEADDRRELQAARDEDDYIPWEDVKADLGLG